MELSTANIVVPSLDSYPVQVGDITDVFCDDGHIFIVAYIDTIDPEIEQLRNEFLKKLGGQLHV